MTIVVDGRTKIENSSLKKFFFSLLESDDTLEQCRRVEQKEVIYTELVLSNPWYWAIPNFIYILV